MPVKKGWVDDWNDWGDLRKIGGKRRMNRKKKSVRSKYGQKRIYNKSRKQ